MLTISPFFSSKEILSITSSLWFLFKKDFDNPSITIAFDLWLIDTWDSKVMNYINKKLNNEANEILKEQISLISSSFNNRKVYID